MKITRHALARSNQRGIPLDLLDLILEYGTPTQRPGDVLEFRLKKRDKVKIVTHLKRLINKVNKADGKGVIESSDGNIITIYHLT